MAFTTGTDFTVPSPGKFTEGVDFSFGEESLVPTLYLTITGQAFVVEDGDYLTAAPTAELTLTGYAPSTSDGVTNTAVPTLNVAFEIFAPQTNDGMTNDVFIPTALISIAAYPPVSINYNFRVASLNVSYDLAVYEPLVAHISGSYDLATFAHLVAQLRASYDLSTYKKALVQISSSYDLSAFLIFKTRLNASYDLLACTPAVSHLDVSYDLRVYADKVTRLDASYDIVAYQQSVQHLDASYDVKTFLANITHLDASYDLLANERFYSWAINLTTGAVSQYDGLAFNSLSGAMGADSTGIHTLSGDTDNGLAINSFVQSGKLDFGMPEHKRLVDAYLGINGGALKLSVTDERTGTSHYNIAATTQLKTSKANLGRGCKGKYWSVRLDNVSGSKCAVDVIEVNIEKLSRRV